jgi:hypothetical protein
MAASRRAVNRAIRTFRINDGVVDDRQRTLIASRIEMVSDEALSQLWGWGPKTVAEVRAWSRAIMANAGPPYRITAPRTGPR